MTGDTVTKKELSELLRRVLDDLERITDVTGDVIVRLDDVQNRIDASKGPDIQN